VSVTHWHGTGATSGLDYSVRAAELTTIREGKIVHLEMGFQDRASALEAVGLRE
jgi:ketosteroid isomerase-like protein